MTHLNGEIGAILRLEVGNAGSRTEALVSDFANLNQTTSLTERYYIYVTESHVMTGFERFTAYQTAGLGSAIKQQPDKVQ